MNKTIARQMIKAVSMRNMQGNWLKAFLFTILSSLILSLTLTYLPITLPPVQELEAVAKSGELGKVFAMFFPEGITNRMIVLVAVVVFLNLFIASPLKVGRCRYFLEVAKGEKPGFGVFFSALTDIKVVFSSILLNVGVAVVSTLWTALFLILPLGVVYAATLTQSVILAYLSIAAWVAAVLFSLLWTSRYNFLFLVFSEGGDIGVFASIRKYMKLMRGRNRECMVLRASYFVWEIVSYLFQPLSIVYQTLFDAVYAKYLSYLKGELSFGEPEIPPEM